MKFRLYRVSLFLSILLSAAATAAPSTATELLTDTFNSQYGYPMLQYTYYLNAAGEKVRHGVETHWYQDQYHLMSERIQYSHGKMHGLNEAWYNASYSQTYQKHWEKAYQNGELHGVSKEWHQTTGYMASYATYKYGKLHGPYRQWHYYNQDQTLEANYQNGLLHGHYKKWGVKNYYYLNYNYGPTQMPVEEGYYTYGKKSGPWKRWWYEASYPWYVKEEGSYGNDSECSTWKYYRSTNGALYSTVNKGACMGTAPPGGDLPLPPGTGYVIRGHVYDKSNNTPLAGALVQAGGSEANADAEGAFSLALDSSDSYALNCVANGYYNFTKTVNLVDAQIVTTDISMKPKEPGAKPAVTNVDSKNGVFFMDGLSSNNEYVVSVDWQDDAPGAVIFEVNGTPREVPAGPSGASATFDMGADFKGSLSPTGNTLKITAVNYSGVSSAPEVLHPIVIPLPSWSLNLGDFEIKQDGNTLTYKLDVSWPEEPIEVLIDENYLGSFLWQAWGLVPYIGGREFGVPGTQSFLEIEAKSDGTGSIAGGGKSGFKAAGGEIGIKLGAKGNLKYEPNTGLEWKETSLIMGVNGSIEKEVGPVTLIPALEGAVNLPLIGGAIGWFNDRAKIKGTVSTGSEMALALFSATGEIAFNKADVETSAGLELGLGIEVIEDLETEIKGGGTSKVFWQVPAAPDYFKKLETELSGNVTFTFWGYEWTTGYSHTFTHPEQAPAAAVSPMAVPVLKPVSRAFLDQGPYNVLVSGPSRAPMDVGGAGAQDAFKIIENIFPHSQPAIAERDGQAAIAYVFLDQNDPVHQETEIYVTLYNGAAKTHTTPAPIKDDTRAEFSPTIAYDSAGSIVCVWQRVKDEQFASSEIEDLAKELEIVYAVYDPAAQSPAWTEPAALTDNAYLDYHPVLKRGADGSLLLIWLSNTGNRLIGNTDHPTQVHYAFWNGTDFGAPFTVPFTFENSFKFSLAYNGDEAILSYMRDMDGVFTTPPDAPVTATADEEIFYTVYDGDTWGTPVRVTDDAIPDTSPQVAYAGTKAELFWLRENALVRLTALAPFAVETIKENALSGGITDFRLYNDPSDHLVLLWQDSDEKGIDIFYAVYDAGNGVWSNDLRLTEDPPMERAFSGVFSASGLLHLVFNKTATDSATTDLHHLTYQLTVDLAIDAAALSIAPAAPAPGDTVTLGCHVRNTGDLSVSDTQVAFYLGDPGAGGTLLGTADIDPAMLKAGQTGQATLAWTIPTDIAHYTVYAVVDPSNTVVEHSESNNKAHFNVIRPDLNMIRCRLEPGQNDAVNVRATLRNDGIIAAENILVQFKAEERVIDTLTIPSLLPGKTAEVVLPAALDYYEYTRWNPVISAVADPDNTIPETDEENNAESDVYALDVISPHAQDFGKAFYESGTDITHYTAAVQTITIFNKTAAQMPIGAIEIVGENAAEFSLPNNTCNGTIVQAYQSCIVGVAFAPTAMGDKTAEVVIHDEQGNPMWRIPLSGAYGNLVRGDLNDDGTVDMADAILALKVSAGFTPEGINAIVEVNGDGRVGIAEALHTLQALAGIER